jgi:hypothetical protein
LGNLPEEPRVGVAVNKLVLSAKVLVVPLPFPVLVVKTNVGENSGGESLPP